MPDAPNDKIAVRCSCGTKLAVPATAVGKNAKCPKCGSVFPITSTEPPPPLVSKVSGTRGAGTTAQEQWHTRGKTSANDEGDSLLSALAEQEKTAEATSSPLDSKIQTPCPKCKTMMEVAAKICVACGYNVETGRSVKVARTQPVAAVKAAKFAGRLSIGVTLSGVGALVGAAIWSGVALGTGYEIGWIAWGVGVLAGLGMRLGYREESGFAGLVAAGMSVAGVLMAKVFIFAYVPSVIVGAAGEPHEVDRMLVTHALAEEELEKAPASSNGPGEDDGERAFEEAEKRVAHMSEEEIRKQAGAYRQAPAPSAEEQREAAKGLLGAFFAASFHPLDALFLLFAVGSAHKIASGGGGE